MRALGFMVALGMLLAPKAVMAQENLACDGPNVTFESGLPSSWTVVLNTGTVYWSTTDDLTACDNGGNQTLGGGKAACADSDQTNSARHPYDTELWSNAFDLSGAHGEAYLQFAAAYKNVFSGGDLFQVWVWNGATWTQELQWDEDHIERVALDLSSYVGLVEVAVSFRYFGDNWDWYAQVDDVSLICEPHIFADGFESGNVSAWSGSVP